MNPTSEMLGRTIAELDKLQHELATLPRVERVELIVRRLPKLIALLAQEDR